MALTPESVRERERVEEAGRDGCGVLVGLFERAADAGERLVEPAILPAGPLLRLGVGAVAEGDHGMEGQPEYDDDNDEKYDEEMSEWQDRLIFEIAEGMMTAMTPPQISLS